MEFAGELEPMTVTPLGEEGLYLSHHAAALGNPKPL